MPKRTWLFLVVLVAGGLASCASPEPAGEAGHEAAQEDAMESADRTEPADATPVADSEGPSESTAPEVTDDLIAHARSLLDEVPFIDGHNDLPWAYRERVSNQLARIDLREDTSGLEPTMHTDLARLKEGGVGGQWWSVYIPVELEGADAVKATFEQIDVVHRLIERYPETFELALTADDVERIHGEGKIASLIGMEGGHSIDDSLGVLRQAFLTGARYMTITHWANNNWADAATFAPEHNGLTAFGREVLREMNRLGMLVDLSHVSPATMHDALDTVTAPVVFSHSSARGVTDHPRNVPDDVLRRMPENGGIVMVTFVQSFVSEERRQHDGRRAAERSRLESVYIGDPERVERELEAWNEANPAPRATLAQVADHIDHVRDVAGIDYLGIGSDYDGIVTTPVGLEDVTTFPALFAELLARGYSDEDIKKIAGLNMLRVMREAEKVAAESVGPPSEVLIEELDG